MTIRKRHTFSIDWRICTARCFNLQVTRSSRTKASARGESTLSRLPPFLREHSKTETVSVAPDTFIPCNSISVSSFAHAKFNLPVVSWPARSRARARVLSHQIQSGFSQFSKFKEMIPPILSPESETALPRFISSSICGLISASLSPVRAHARWSNFQGKLKNCYEQIGSCARVPKLAMDEQKR